MISYLEDILGPGIATNKGMEYHWDCPLCGDTRKRLYINTETHRVWCHNCEFGGSVISFISNLEGISYQEALKFYRSNVKLTKVPVFVKDEVMNIFNSDFDFTKYYSKKIIPFPEDYTLLEDSSSYLGNMVKKYLKYRKISDKQMILHKFGYCYEGNYKNRAILPISEAGQVIFWVARSIKKKEKGLKEIAPSNEDWQIGKSDVIFNIDRAAQIYNTAVLTEGIFDALMFGDVGTSLLGHSLSESQLNVLLRYKEQLTNGVFIALDEDAWKDSIAIARELYQFFPTFICKVKNDPNALGRKGCIKLISSAAEYSPLKEIKIKLLN